VTIIDRKRELWREAQRRRRAKPGVRQLQAERQAAYLDRDGVRERRRYTAIEKYMSVDGWKSMILARLRHRAKKRGWEFSITADDLELPEFCPVLGMKLVARKGIDARTSPCAPSVDRFDNSKGYIPGNVRVISARANVLKNDATLEEVRAILRYMEGGMS